MTSQIHPGLILRQLLKRAVGVFFLLRLIATTHALPLSSILKLRRAGNGRSDTLLLPGSLVIKTRNPLREKDDIQQYVGPHRYDGYLQLSFQGKFEYEFDCLIKLTKCDLAPTPLQVGPDYLILAYITGARSLDRTLEDDATISMEVVAAIERMHALGIYHGDLNCGNILVTDDRKIRFIDFESRFEESVPEMHRKSLDYLIFLEKLQRFHPLLAAQHIPAFCRDILKVHPSFAVDSRRFADWIDARTANTITQAEAAISAASMRGKKWD